MLATSVATMKRRTVSRSIRRCLVAALPFLVPSGIAAQQRDAVPITMINGDADERQRLQQLLGEHLEQNILIRSSARALSAADTLHRPWIAAGLADARIGRNSGLAYSLNDGPVWAGRGWYYSLTPVFAARWRRIQVVAAPTFAGSDNLPYQVIPFRQDIGAGRSIWANPFHPLPESIDLPLRFGARRVRFLDPGQSSVTVDAGRAAFGFATQNVWWGPGIRNAITLSNNAAGFAHLFLQTKAPIATRFGTFDGQWIVGQLTESEYFDVDPSNDHPSLAGLVGTWTTPFDSTLTLGAARLVIGKRRGGTFPASAFVDVFRTVGHLNVNAVPVPPDARDQIFSLFARWLFPAAHFEAYVEWARFEEPLSLRDFLEYPGHSEGYTLGFQWAHPLTAQRAFRLQGEATYLEPDPSLRLRPTAVTYTSRAVPQGFTQRGQMLGAAIGPGASSQWLAGDLVARRWHLGTYLSRIRWDNGTLEEPIVPFFKRQDITLIAGLRAGWSWRDVDASFDFSHGVRLNYLFQAYPTGVGTNTNGIDLLNNALSVNVSTPLTRVIDPLAGWPGRERRR